MLELSTKQLANPTIPIDFFEFQKPYCPFACGNNLLTTLIIKYRTSK